MWNCDNQFNGSATEWRSGKRSSDQMNGINVHEMHSALYKRVDESVNLAFGAINRALNILKGDLQLKLRNLADQQEGLIIGSRVNDEETELFSNNVRKIVRSLDRITEHAGNLSHIKLTISRLAALTSPTGDLAQLVVGNHKGAYRDVQPPLPSPVNQYEQKLEHPARTVYEDSHNISIHAFNQAVSTQTQNTVAHRPTKPASETRGKTCFIFYLPSRIDNLKLRSLFVPFGNVLNAYVAVDKHTGLSKGYGFVDYASVEEAQLAVSVMDAYRIDDKILSVSIKI